MFCHGCIILWLVSKAILLLGEKLFMRRLVRGAYLEHTWSLLDGGVDYAIQLQSD